MDALPPPYNPSTLPSDSPYNTHEVITYSHYTQLPAFNTPRKYSSRLRRLLQQRSSSRGVYLTLHIPGNSNSCTFVSIESASSSEGSTDSRRSSSEASDRESDGCSDASSEKNVYITTEKTPLLAGLSAGIPLVEDLEAGTLDISSIDRNTRRSLRSSSKRDPRYRSSHRRRRHHQRSSDRSETSWLAFFGLLLLIFTIVCAAGVLVAWATGFTSGRLSAAKYYGNGMYNNGVASVASGSEFKASASVATTTSESSFIQHDASSSASTEDVVESLKAKVRRSRVWRERRNVKRGGSVGFPVEARAEDVMEDVTF